MTSNAQNTGVGSRTKQIDFATLPDQALLNANQVRTLCSMSPAVLDRRICEGRFPLPNYHGRNRVWPWAKVKAWLELAAQQETPVSR